MGRVVERSEIAADFDLLHHVFINEHRAAEKVGTLHDTVTDCVDLVEMLDDTGLGVGKGVEHELHAESVVGNGLHHHYRLLAGGLVGEFAVGQRYLFEITFGEKGVLLSAFHIQKLVLDR